MKKLIYVIATLFLAFSISANAQIVDKINYQNDDLNRKIDFNSQFEASDFTSVKSEKTQALTWETIILQYQALYFNLYSRCTPIAYDPVSDLVMVVGPKFQYAPGALSKIIGEVYYKKPAATRWDSIKVFNEDEMGICNPSIAINNYNNATTMANMGLTIYGRYAASHSEWRFTSLGYAFKDGSEITPDLSDYPEANNPGNQYSWSMMKMVSNPNSTKSYAVGSLMVPMTTTVPAGAYGFFSTDLSSQSSIHSTIPSEWAMSIFRSAPSLTNSYNASSEFAIDKAGNIYLALNNIFANDENNRIPAVSMSENGGASWTSFNRMPASLIESYAASTSFEFAGSYQPYDMKNGFIAWGTDSYSYFYPLFLASQDTIREIHLVEAKYANSEWSLTKVAEINGFLPFVFYASDLYPNATDKFRISQINSSGNMGYEIQAAMTADGQYLVVKWIDQGLNPDGSGKFAEFNPAVSVTVVNGETEQDATLPGMSILDIFIARRKLDNPKWHVLNATNDDRSYKATWIPSIVPDVNNIPLLAASTPTYQDQTNPFNSLPVVMRDRIIEFPAFFFTYTRVTDPMSVEETASNNSFKVFDVYPNPVTDLVEFTYELSEPGNVRLELFNSLGQSVRVIFDNHSTEGMHGINVDLSDLSSAVYYYTLTTGGNSSTKVLNVVR